MLNEIKAKTKERMLKTIQSFHDDIKGVRTGRASASLLDGIVVNIYGGHQKLNQVAGVSVIDNKTLSIKVWDINVVGEVIMIRDRTLSQSVRDYVRNGHNGVGAKRVAHTIVAECEDRSVGVNQLNHGI